MTDPTNPGDIPDPGAAAPPPPPPAPPAPPPPPAPGASFPPPPSSGGFPPPTQAMPVVGGPVGPPPGPATTKSKGPLIAAIAVVALLLGAVGFVALSGGDDDKDDVSTNPIADDASTTSTTDKPSGPGGKEGAADEGEKDDERPDDTVASGEPDDYGDDPTLDALYDSCEAGDYQACDDLYMDSGFGTAYEEFGDTCGDRNEPSGYCAELYGEDGSGTDSVDGSGAMSYGDDAALDNLYDLCAEGDYAACDTLYMESDFGSEYEEFGDTCGDRNEPSGYCEELYAEGGD